MNKDHNIAVSRSITTNENGHNIAELTITFNTENLLVQGPSKLYDAVFDNIHAIFIETIVDDSRED